MYYHPATPLSSFEEKQPFLTNETCGTGYIPCDNTPLSVGQKIVNKCTFNYGSGGIDYLDILRERSLGFNSSRHKFELVKGDATDALSIMANEIDIQVSRLVKERTHQCAEIIKAHAIVSNGLDKAGLVKLSNDILGLNKETK